MRFKKIWVYYFFIKVFFLFFAFFVFARLTSLGDTSSYLNAPLTLTPSILYSSTDMMFFLGSLLKKIFRVDVIASLPFMFLSFYGVYYAVDRLNLYRYPKLVLLIMSMPNFGVWTSVLSKEAVGCFFSGVIAVLLVRQIAGDYKYRLIDFIALYLCLIYKPQYLLFIGQALVFLRIIKWTSLKPSFTFVLGLIIVSANVLVLFIFRETIDLLAQGMYVHFMYSDPDLAQSTRSADPWFVKFGVFKEAPYGMFISFVGPTLREMMSKPTHFVSGIESYSILFMYSFLLINRIVFIIKTSQINIKITFVYLIVFLGILFVHYPFGYLNPGSAIRYRENFYLTFSILLLFLYDYKQIITYIKARQFHFISIKNDQSNSKLSSDFRKL